MFDLKILSFCLIKKKTYRFLALHPPSVPCVALAQWPFTVFACPFLCSKSKACLSARSSLEVRTSSWSGPSGRASARSRRGWGGCGSRRSRTWSWPSLSARPTCPPPDQPWPRTQLQPFLLLPRGPSHPQVHHLSTSTGTNSVSNLCGRPVNFQTWLDACEKTTFKNSLLTNVQGNHNQERYGSTGFILQFNAF